MLRAVQDVGLADLFDRPHTNFQSACDQLNVGCSAYQTQLAIATICHNQLDWKFVWKVRAAFKTPTMSTVRARRTLGSLSGQRFGREFAKVRLIVPRKTPNIVETAR